ncbi:MAG: hypothetical protein VB078_08425 [Clostridiaceae bacterium]|nr:hypothetical protein [Clostridiaceae bacterium]
MKIKKPLAFVLAFCLMFTMASPAFAGEVNSNPTKDKEEIVLDTMDPVVPTDPTDPTDPVAPTDPTEPTDPVAPTDPTEPTDPVVPTDPTDPTDPVVPTDPTQPTQPTDPVNPQNPVDPTTPTDPSNPVGPVNPENPVTPVTPANPAEPNFGEMTNEELLEYVSGLTEEEKSALIESGKLTDEQKASLDAGTVHTEPDFAGMTNEELLEYVSGLTEEEKAALIESGKLTDEQKAALDAGIAPTEPNYAEMSDEVFEAYAKILTKEEQEALLASGKLSEAQMAILTEVMAAGNFEMPDVTGWSAEELYDFYMALEDNDIIDAFLNALTEEQNEELSEYIYSVTFGTDLDPVINSESFTEASEPLMPPVQAEMRSLSRSRMASFSLMSLSTGYGFLTALSNPEDNEHVHVGKTIADNGDGYTLSLDAFVDGSTTVSNTNKRKPLDAVLVLDVSSSMTTTISTSSEDVYTSVYSLNTNRTYYVYIGDEYVRVTYYRYNRVWAWYDAGNTKYTPKTYSGDTSSGHFQFYNRTTVTTNISRLDALKTSVTNFLQTLANDAKDQNVQHRVSIIAYSDYVESSMTCGLKTVYSGTMNGTEAGINSIIETCVNNLTDRLSTYPNLAMEEAVKVFNGTSSYTNDALVDTQTPRQRITVFFTDGMAGYKSSDPAYHSFSSAGNTIKFANVLKTATTDSASFTASNWYNYNGGSYMGTQSYSGNGCGATVYTVGMISGLAPSASDPVTSSTSYENRYLHYTSSNYPDADSFDYSSSFERGDGNYFLSVTDADDLEQVFTNIAESTTSGSAGVALDESTILRDVLTDDVVLDYDPATEDPEDAVRVYTCDYAGSDAWAGSLTDVTGLVTINADVATGTIEVTNYDYAENFVWDNPEATPGYGGQKLVVEIDIRPAGGSFGGNGIPTNVENGESGIFKDDDGYSYFTSPSIDLPLDYEIASNDKTIYLGNSTNLEDLLAYESAYYTPDGQNNAYVDITYTLRDPNGVSMGTYTIWAGETSGSWAWTNGGTDEPIDCSTYTLECEVTADGCGYFETDDTHVHIDDNELFECDSVSPMIHVLKPTIAAMDIWANYDVTVDLAQWGITDTETPANVTWADFEVSHSSIPAAQGVAPSITGVEFAKADNSLDGTLAGDNFSFTTAEDDNSFNVTKIYIGAQPFVNTIGDTYFAVTPVDGTGHDLTVHINHFSLTVTKNVSGNHASDLYKQSFVFRLTDDGGTVAEFAINGAGSKTVDGLLCGKSYTVREDTDWSWRYVSVSGNNATISHGGNHAAIANVAPGACSTSATITNSLNDNKWLTNDEIRTNQFTHSAAAGSGS